MNRQNTQTQQAKLRDSQRREMRHKAPSWPIWATVTEPEVKPAKPAKVSGTAPNPNRRRDEALKLLNRGGELCKEGIARFYIEISGKRYAVRKKIAGLLLAQRGALERTVRGTISRWALTFLGRAWIEVTL